MWSSENSKCSSSSSKDHPWWGPYVYMHWRVNTSLEIAGKLEPSNEEQPLDCNPGDEFNLLDIYSNVVLLRNWSYRITQN